MIDHRPLLALDPSSTAVGWALLSPRGELLRAGAVRASSGDFRRRVAALLARLEPVLDRAGDCRVACEWHGGLPAARARTKTRNAAATATLCHGQGVIVGWLWSRGVDAELVSDREWTGDRPKEHRAATVRLLFPAFADVWAADRGLDAHDAAGLGYYCLKLRAPKRATIHR